jgi:hypothetical protein
MAIDYIVMAKVEGYKPRIPAHVVALLLKGNARDN